MLIESSRAYGRGCLLGVAAYLRSHGPWMVTHFERGQTEGVPRAIRQWHGDGVIARLERPEVAEVVASFGVPVVDLRGAIRPVGGAMVNTDHTATAQLAADHFMEIGFTRFAYCGLPGVEFSDAREQAFVAHLAMHSYEVSCYRSRAADDLQGPGDHYQALTEEEGERIGKWLNSLPGPVAVWACNDERGRQVVDACQASGLAVPEQVAVLGVDNDQVLCELSNPPLSSIEPDTHQIGYRGAELLDRMIDGQAPPAETVMVPPRGLHRRVSTEATAVDDQAVASAMRIIRDRACQGVSVEEVAHMVSASRSTLERRFRRAFGRSPAAEIERLRIAKAKLLLAETDDRLAKVARSTGYKSPAQLIAAFKRQTERTPGQYRIEKQS
ncbi:MAG: DNA-binding transcriptional regulator [Planctomycetota bacterium]